jgi:Flp pilus assembly protein TadD
MTREGIEDLLAQATRLHQAGKFEAAIAAYETIIAAGPADVATQMFLAAAYRSAGRPDDAIAVYDAMAETDPQRADFWFNRGNALGDAGRREEAIAAYQRSLELDPQGATALANKAISEVALGRFDDAADSYRRALAIDPAHRIALNNFGNLLVEQGHLAEAAACLRRAVSLAGDMPEEHYNLSHVLLRLGDFANGFREYEWRWKTGEFFEKPRYRDVADWTGQPLAGRRLIVHAEQGLGDTIQFAKLLAPLMSLGGDVVFHVPEKLERLLGTLSCPVTVTSAQRASDGDFQVALMSLPHRLKLTFGSVPSDAAFLSAEPALATAWAERLGLGGQRPVIGFVWQGNPNSPAERGRSLPSPEILAPFSSLEGARLMALQMLPAEALEPASTPSGWRVRGLSFTLEHPGPDMDRGRDAFVDTAAIMAGIDLFASVCTAPLHVAGAIGCPSIAMLKVVPDWRWLLDRADTPWYPAMQLVRQQRGEDFSPLVARAVAAARSRLKI